MTKQKMTKAQRRRIVGQRRRIVGTSALCASASALFLGPAALLPGADVSGQLALVGLVGPAAVAVLWWNVIIPPRMVRDVDTRTRWRPQVEDEAPFQRERAEAPR